MIMNKPVWTPIKIKLGDIIGWEHNPRLSNKAQAQRLIESEKRWGQPMAFAVSPLKDGKVFLYDGHQRYSAWLTVYGEDYEVDARQSDIFLTEDERLEFVVTMHAGATGSWDWQKLSSFPAPKLIEMGFDEALKKQYDFDANNIKELLNSEQAEPVDAEPQIDRAAELQEKWQTASGQLWKLGEHRLLIADCTVRENVERLMGGERADCVMTDPPYGMNLNADYEAMSKNSTKVKGVKYSNVIGDDKDFDPRPYIAMFPEAKEQLWWGADYYYDKLPPNGSWMVWVKRNEKMTDIIGNHFEVCWSMGSHKRRVIYKAWSGVTARNPDFPREHPTEKPIALLGDLINELSDIGNIIVDIFAGSGTTIIAAHNLNRRCYAMEISEKYGAVILERFYTATGIQPELESTEGSGA